MTYEQPAGEVGAFYMPEPLRDPDQQHDDDADYRADREWNLTRDELLRSRILLARRDTKTLVESFAALLDEHTAANDSVELWMRSIEHHIAGIRGAIAYMSKQ
jgi:hypothetical protein